MAKIKILYITGGNLFDNRHRELLSVVRNLDREKYEFSIVCPDNTILLERLLIYDVPVYAIELPGRISSKFRDLLAKLQMGEKFNIVHSFDFTSGLYSRLMKKGFPDIACVHSPQPLAGFEKSGFVRRQVDKSTMQYLSQFTDCMILENETDRMLALKNKYIGETNSSVIPPSVNISGFANLKKKSNLLRSLGFDDNNFIVGNISNFYEESNQQVLIRSAYYLVRKYPQMKFIFIGSGRRLKSMIELVRQSNLEECIIFIQQEESIEDYYSIFDLFVMSDSWGGSSSILLEAMASKLPVVCSSTSVYKSILSNNFSNVLFDPSNMDELYYRIDELYSDEEKRISLGQNALIEATQYDESEIFPQVEFVYRKLVQQ